MRRFFGHLQDGRFVVEGDEFKHLTGVIRLKAGDNFVGICGDEFEYVCQIENLGKKQALANVLSKSKAKANPQKEIVLFQALTKKDAFETIVQKACELGASALVPFESEFSVNKSGINLERYRQIVLSACKQCGRSRLMQIEDMISFDQMLGRLQDFDVVIFANENQAPGADFVSAFDKSAQKIAVIVGCEGGFSQGEIQKLLSAKNLKSVSLGSRILRADTASIIVVGLASLLGNN